MNDQAWESDGDVTLISTMMSFKSAVESSRAYEYIPCIESEPPPVVTGTVRTYEPNEPNERMKDIFFKKSGHSWTIAVTLNSNNLTINTVDT